MIILVEALNYRCLRYVKQSLGRFQVLIGPNASGKSTFLDVVAFLGDLLRDGLTTAIADRAPNLQDLVWGRTGTRFELAVELAIPENGENSARQYEACRYEVAVGTDEETRRLRILAETLWLLPRRDIPKRIDRTLFPIPPEPPDTIVFGSKTAPSGWRTVVKKIEESGNDYFKSEKGNWNIQFRFGPTKPALANLPEDPTKFPVATWAKRFLMNGIQSLALNSLSMRQPSPSGLGRRFRPDGSNLPFVVQRLQKKSPERFSAWIDHVRTVLPDLQTIRVRERPEDRNLYLTLVHTHGLRVPSWLVSDGTLRLLTLTLLAYAQLGDSVYLIEEPENGIHPHAVQTVFQSLSSAYDSQILVATHSPVFLGLAEASQLLCFNRAETGETDIVAGNEHPKLKDWKGEVSLSDLFAAGVLG
jgi:predicted ATPase